MSVFRSWCSAHGEAELRTIWLTSELPSEHDENQSPTTSEHTGITAVEPKKFKLDNSTESHPVSVQSGINLEVAKKGMSMTFNFNFN